MASKGTFGAYTEAYKDKPIDYGAAINKAVGEGIDVGNKVRADEKLKQEREAERQANRDERNAKEAARKEENDKRETTRKNENNAKIYSAAAQRIALQDNAPPSAQAIANLAGDEIFNITKQYPESLDRAARIEDVIRKTNMVTTSITNSALSLEKAPTDNFTIAGGYYDNARSMLKGDLTPVWIDGKMRIQGTRIGKNDKLENVDLTIEDFMSSISPPDSIKQVNTAGAVTALTNTKKEKDIDLKTVEGQQSYVRSALTIANQTLNFEQSPGAVMRYLYNNVEAPSADKDMMLDLGKKLQSGELALTDLNADQLKLVEKYLPAAKNAFAKSLVGNLQKPSKSEGVAIGSGSGSNTPHPSTILDDKSFTSNTLSIIDSVIEHAGVNPSQISDIVSTLKSDDGSWHGIGPDARWTSEDGEVTIELEESGVPGFENKGHGFINVKDVDGQFEYGGDTGVTIEQAIQKALYGEHTQTVMNYSPKTVKVGDETMTIPRDEVTKGENFGIIASKLKVYYANEGYNFKPLPFNANGVSDGVSVRIGNKDIVIPDLTKLSPEMRAKKIQQYITLASK